MTPERLARINAFLDARQPDLTVVMEKVHKPHNLSAVVRTCDAVGIHEVHAIWMDRKSRLVRGTSMGSQDWVKVSAHDDISSCAQRLKQQGFQLLATNLSERAVDFRDIDYTQPTAIILGQERQGISDEALALADQHIVVPMVGMVQSLNVSVANAIILYEAQRQRHQAGLYQQPRIPESERQRLLFEGGHPIFAKACKRKGLPYPAIDEQGQIVADEAWWQQMQMTPDAWSHMDDDDA